MTSPTLSPRRALVVLVALLAMLCALAFASAPASALTVHVYKSSFGAPCSSSPCGKGQFKLMRGVAVNEVTPGYAGDVYVVDRNDKRIEVFNAEGTYLSEFALPGTSSEPQAIAIDNSKNVLDPSAGDIYVTDDVPGGAVYKFSAGGAYLGQIAGGESGAPFYVVEGIAVDPNGVVWVLSTTDREEETFNRYSDALANEFLTSFNAHEATSGFAVDSEDNIYDVTRGVVLKLNSSGEVLSPKVDSSGSYTEAVTVDPSTDDVYLAEENTADRALAIAAFGPTGALIERFGAGELTSSGDIAIDSASGTAYVTDPGANAVRIFTAVAVPETITGEVSNLQQSGGLATLNGTVGPGGAPVTSCEFEYGENESYGQIAACEPSAGELGSGDGPIAVHADLKELVPLTTYHFRLMASSSTGTQDGSDQTFFIPTSPAVSGESASGVGSTTATVGAQIDPGGLLSTYRVEYGLSSAYGFSTPEASVGAGVGVVGVQAQLSDLQPGGVVYHFRLLATNALGTVASGDLTFATASRPAASGLALPDNRAYELVSPIDNADGDVFAPEMGEIDLSGGGEPYNSSPYPFQASPEGSAIVYQADPTPAGGNGQVAHGVGNEFLATRNAAGGWTARDIQPPYNQPRFEIFSEDLSVGVVGDTGSPLLGFPGADGIDMFSFNTSAGSYQPVYPSHESIESFEYENGGGKAQAGIEGLSADGSHLLFAAHAKLTASSPEPGAANNLYDSVEGRLALVNVLPNGTSEPNAIFGGIPPSESEPEVPDYSHDISADGSRIFWTDLSTHKLYVRENDTQPPSPLGAKGECIVSGDACTVEVDASHDGSVASGDGQFWTASRNGEAVFFTACTRLTEDSTAVSGAKGCAHGGEGKQGDGGLVNIESEPPTYTGNDLYEYDVKEGTLTDLTVDHNPSDPLGANVQSVIGTSEDGSYVYFLAGGMLASNANSENEKASTGTCISGNREANEIGYNTSEIEAAEKLEGKEGGLAAGRACNLYVSHNGGPAVFIAAISPQTKAKLLNSEVAPDGQGLVFESRQRLTGYDNWSKQFGGHLASEVFLYDLDTHHLTCVSCNSSGAPAEYGADLGGEDSNYFEVANSNDLYHPHWISSEGSRVFFNSGDPLVPQDSNGNVDVYEWEQDGTGSCQQSTGCVYLLSGGVSPNPSYFVDASTSGEDVFFVTRAQLLAQDRNENTDLYDARVNGGVSQLTESVCTGTGCQGVPPAPPIFATPASVTFNGVGNFSPPVANAVTPKKTTAQLEAERLAKALQACKNQPKRQRASCKRRARNRYGSRPRAKKSAKGRN